MINCFAKSIDLHGFYTRRRNHGPYLRTAQIAFHAIASHLCTHPAGEVAFIDTTGSFSPLHMRKILAFRIQAQLDREKYQASGFTYDKRPKEKVGGEEAVFERANAMLDRVKLMRVFDFAGVVEAIGEVNERRERSVLEEKAGKAAAEKRVEVIDSEEDSDEKDSDAPARPKRSRVGEQYDHEELVPESGTVGMLVMDTIVNVIGSSMPKSQIQGQALLASFMRSLHHLARRHHMCVILVNATVGFNPSNNPQNYPRLVENASVFSSTTGKPALGKTLTYLIDTSIFLSAVPKTIEDASRAFGENAGVLPFKKALVFEVLKDRCGNREGRWSAFEIVGEVKIAPCAMCDTSFQQRFTH